MVEVLIKQSLGGRYKITQLLGQSLFSDTYLAKDRQLPNSPMCVVKCLKAPPHDRFDWTRARALFNAEAEALYRLGPHSSQIPRLLAHFEENQQFYLVHEYVEGQDLSRELILGQPMPEDRVAKLMEDLLEVLAVIHAQGVIHRDIKPQNLIRRAKDGKIVLIDFGAVKQLSLQPVHHQTTESILIGTPGYMASEQRAGKPRYCSDIYSVGMIAIQALTGLNPKEIGEDVQGELCWRQIAHVSPRLAEILTKMVRAHWRDRYSTVAQVLADLKRLKKRPSSPIVPALILITTLALSGVIARHINQIKTILAQPPTPARVQASQNLISIRTIKQSNAVLTLAMHPQRAIVASGGEDKMIQLWDMQGNRLTTLMGHLKDITALHFTPDGETLVSASADATAKIWNLQSGTLHHTLVGHEGRINSTYVSPNGQLTVTGGSDRLIKVWDIASGSELQSLSGHTSAINQLEMTQDGKYIISASEDKTLKIWNLATGENIQTLTGHASGVKAVVANPKNQILASGADDGILVWNLASGQRLRTLASESKDARSLAFSSDGQYLLSSHTDGSLKLWNWQTGRLIETVRGHSDSVGAIAICPEPWQGQRILVTGGLDHRLGIWKLHL
jgi:serine/threonine protein kinase